MRRTRTCGCGMTFWNGRRLTPLLSIALLVCKLHGIGNRKALREGVSGAYER